MDPKNKVALVTGGGTGIGRATALLLARHGADVAVNFSQSKDEAEATAREIETLGRRAAAIQADVGDNNQARTLVEKTVAQFGRLDILINNAGYTEHIDLKDLASVTDHTWDRTFSVNVKGPFYCARAAAPHMQNAGEGVVVNVSSLAGTLARGNSIPYCASKAALDVVTRILARVLAPAIRVNAVAPGVVNTRWVDGQTGFVRAAQMQTPMRRIAEPEDVAEVILHLVTSCNFVTGQILPVDGGMSA